MLVAPELRQEVHLRARRDNIITTSDVRTRLNFGFLAFSLFVQRRCIAKVLSIMNHDDRSLLFIKNVYDY